MGHASIVNGFIIIRSHELMEQTKGTINSFDFDEVWPFTNIFWCDSPAQYSNPVVGFGGSYKQIEEVWSEWLWKLGQLLSRLDAIEARVNLHCVIGDYSWELRPKAYCESKDWPQSMLGEPWVVASAPEKDFSIDPEWIEQVEGNLFTPDAETGELVRYKWDKFLERVPVAWIGR